MTHTEFPARNSGLEAHWMPFTSNRDFKKSPRIVTSASGHYYHSEGGRKLYDGFSGLWTTGIGHCHPKISEAVSEQIRTLDYAISFQATSNKAVELAGRLTNFAPDGFDHVFFTGSGSESADTALKIALAYHRAKGEPLRSRFVGRERGYHGVNFGGISVGGIPLNRKAFSTALLPNVDHLPHTHSLEHAAFSKGQPEWGAEQADALPKICTMRDGSTIAAVIVEPVAGSTGILPPPKGYLEKLRAHCDAHGILLIFDEVITAFGRVGHSFAAERFGVVPDIITIAKGLTNGAIPMGAVLVRSEIYDALMQGPEHLPELFHGYTYSGHPVAAAAGLASLDIYESEDVFAQARALEPVFEDILHTFSDHPLVIDVRNIGLMGAIELCPRDGEAGARGLEVHKKCFWEQDFVIRNGGDILQFAPFLTATPGELEQNFAKLRTVLDEIA